MMQVKIYSLYSGSRGNSMFIRVGDTAILIDAGKNARALCGALSAIGENIQDVSAMFITHEHSDHVAALELLAKKNSFPIFITRQSAQKFAEGSPLRERLSEREILFSETVGDIKIISFPTSHDSLMSVGYRIEFSDEDGNHAIGYATDMGYVSLDVKKALLGCEAVIIECNHDESMLMSGPYPSMLKHRVSSKKGHLSNRACAELACELVQNGTRAIMLAHLSAENNEPELAFDEVSSAISGFDVNLCVADQYTPVELTIPTRKEE